jgi:hypothetical protein
MLAGTIAVAATLCLAWMQLQRIETRTFDILHRQILSELDLQSFHQQLQALETEERATAGEYSPQQLEILQADMQVLGKEIQAATERLRRISLQRDEVAQNVVITLCLSLIALSAGIMLVIFGFIGWRYRIRVVEEP